MFLASRSQSPPSSRYRIRLCLLSNCLAPQPTSLMKIPWLGQDFGQGVGAHCAQCTKLNEQILQPCVPCTAPRLSSLPCFADVLALLLFPGLARDVYVDNTMRSRPFPLFKATHFLSPIRPPGSHRERASGSHGRTRHKSSCAWAVENLRPLWWDVEWRQTPFEKWFRLEPFTAALSWDRTHAHAHTCHVHPRRPTKRRKASCVVPPKRSRPGKMRLNRNPTSIQTAPSPLGM